MPTRSLQLNLTLEKAIWGFPIPLRNSARPPRSTLSNRLHPTRNSPYASFQRVLSRIYWSKYGRPFHPWLRGSSVISHSSPCWVSPPPPPPPPPSRLPRSASPDGALFSRRGRLIPCIWATSVRTANFWKLIPLAERTMSKQSIMV